MFEFSEVWDADKEEINFKPPEEVQEILRRRESIWRKERRLALLAQNLCTRCGVNEILPENGARCIKCIIKKREKKRILKKMVFNRYGGPKCACCGEHQFEFLQIDHINGGGIQHRKEISNGNGDGIYYWLKKHNYPKGYRVLCANCNFALGAYGYCPHQLDREVTDEQHVKRIAARKNQCNRRRSRS